MARNVCCGRVTAMNILLMQHATYEDLMHVPEHRVAEIIDGALYSMPRPAVPHAKTSSMLAGHIIGPFSMGLGGPGGWFILFEPELHLGSDVVVPDLGGWRCERMPSLPNTAFIELAPDWVCEVLSPGTYRLDRTRKMRIYAREGVGHLWFIDPIERMLEVYRLVAGQWMVVSVFADDEVVRAEPFDAIEINLALLWSREQA